MLWTVVVADNGLGLIYQIFGATTGAGICNYKHFDPSWKVVNTVCCDNRRRALPYSSPSLNSSRCGRSKTYRHQRHCVLNSIGCSVLVGVLSVLSPKPGLKRTGTHTPRHQLPNHLSVISAN